MGMPIAVEVVDDSVSEQLFAEIFNYFAYVDDRYSTYKTDSEISAINRGLPISRWSVEMKTVLDLCEQTKLETNGYFDIKRDGKLDPSGLVKGWAIQQAGSLLKQRKFHNFYIDAGGDVQVSGKNNQGLPWRIGIRNPFNRDEIIKTLSATTEGIATSGTAVRGQHIYNPLLPGQQLTKVVSLTVVGPNIYDADRFATAAFAMGTAGVTFIEALDGFEAYMVGADRIATMTSGFEKYVATDD